LRQCQNVEDYRPAALKVTSDGGSVTSREAVSLGLIVTELVLNALKHAFPDNNKSDRQIAVRKLSVADNGIGAPVGVFAQAKSGLGTSIVNALAQQLDAKVEVLSRANGTVVSVSHTTFSGAVNPVRPGWAGQPVAVGENGLSAHIRARGLSFALRESG
jgi:two-component sensor histidine kinase